MGTQAIYLVYYLCIVCTYCIKLVQAVLCTYTSGEWNSKLVFHYSMANDQFCGYIIMAFLQIVFDWGPNVTKDFYGLLLILQNSCELDVYRCETTSLTKDYESWSDNYRMTVNMHSTLNILWTWGIWIMCNIFIL